jgi:hypothetical protein
MRDRLNVGEATEPDQFILGSGPARCSCHPAVYRYRAKGGGTEPQLCLNTMQRSGVCWARTPGARRWAIANTLIKLRQPAHRCRHDGEGRCWRAAVAFGGGITKAGMGIAQQFTTMKSGQSGGLRGHHPVPASAGQGAGERMGARFRGGTGAPARSLRSTSKKLMSRHSSIRSRRGNVQISSAANMLFVDSLQLLGRLSLTSATLFSMAVPRCFARVYRLGSRPGNFPYG